MVNKKEVKETPLVKLLNISIYTDGACSGNPGPGGWGALLLIKNSDLDIKEKVVVKGGEKHTTNNRMELTAVIESLKFISKNLKQHKLQIRINSDSSYIVDSINKGSILTWQNNGWKTTKQTDVVNKDLWEQLIALDNILSPAYIKVKGHSGNKFNEYVDKIAVKECNKYKQILNNL